MALVRQLARHGILQIGIVGVAVLVAGILIAVV